MSLGGCLSTNWMVLVHDGKLFKLFLSKKVTFVLSVLSDVYDLRTTLTDSEKLKPRFTGSCFMSQSDASVTVFPDHSLKWNKFYLTYGWKSSSSSSELQFLYGKEEPFEIATAPNLWIRSSVDNSALLVSVRPGFESWRSLNFFLRLLSSNCLTCCSPKRTTAIVDLIVDLIITGATKYVWLLRGTEIKGKLSKTRFFPIGNPGSQN